MQHWQRQYRSCLSTLLSLAVIVERSLLSVSESGGIYACNIIERSPLGLLLLSRPLCFKDYFAVLISVSWARRGKLPVKRIMEALSFHLRGRIKMFQYERKRKKSKRTYCNPLARLVNERLYIVIVLIVMEWLLHS